MKVLARTMIAAAAVLAFASPAAAQSERQIDIRGQFGGIFCCSEAGLVLGGGLGARPFNNQQVEIAADASFLRWAGDNGLYLSGNGLYHFKTSEPNFSPFAGAGLAILNIFESTEVRFQIAGGVDVNKSGKYPIRPEVRFIFTEGDVTTVLLVGIQFGKR